MTRRRTRAGRTDGDGTVTYTDDFNNVFNQFLISPVLTLKFPAADITDTFTNSVTVDAVPVNQADYEDTPTASDDIDFLLESGPLEGQFDKSNSASYHDNMDSKVLSHTWTVSLKNPTGLDMENIIVEDYNLDGRLQYVSIANTTASADYVGSYTIEATSDGTNWTTIVSDADISDTTAYDLPADTIRVRMSSTSGSYLKPSGTFKFTLTTEMKDPENTHNTTTYVFNMYNYASYSANFVGSTVEATGTDSGYCYFYPYSPRIDFAKFVASASSSLLVNDEITFRLDLRETNANDSRDNVEAQTMIDFLPVGLEYVPGSAIVWYRNPASADAIVSIEPAIIENCYDSGKTALIWTFDNPIYFGPAYNSVFYWVSYRAVATIDMDAGDSTNDAYFIWDNNGYGDSEAQTIYAYTLFGPAQTAADSYDLDGDGNTEERVLWGDAVITFSPPKEVVAKKYVQGKFDSNLINSGGRTEIGDWAKYQLDATNHSLIAYNKLTVIDVLPYVGDTTICKDEGGIYQSRESEFPVLLTGPATAPDGFTVYYTNDYPSDTDNKAYDYAADANWVTTPSDYSKVIGVKFVMDEGESFEVEETCSFGLPLAISDADPTLKSEQKAVNTFALSTNGTDYLEALNTTLRVVSYEVEGTVFEDTDEDGIMDSGEVPIGGVKVWLTDGEGNVANDVGGNPFVTTTDENGYYHFDVQQTNNYSVSFTEPINYAPTPVTKDPSEAQGSHVLQGEDNTDIFFIGIETYTEQWTVVRNAGYYRDAASIQVSKELYDVDNDLITDERTFEFAVRIGGLLYNGPAIINGQTVTITNGVLRFSNGAEVFIHEIPFETSYSVTEINADDYGVSPLSQVFSGTMTIAGRSVTFENTELPGSIGDYIWNDVNADGVQDAGETGIEGVTVELVDEYGNVVDTAVTNVDGLYLFADVAPGTYNVVVTPPDGYLQTYEKDNSLNCDTEVIVTTNADILDVDYGFQQLATIGSTVWVDTNGNGVKDESELGLENITVQLIDDKGNVVATTTTDANGQYLFTDVPMGTYDIVITPPDNYNQTYELDGKLDGDTSVTVAPGEEKLDVNFGFQPFATIGSTVWVDTNGNDVKDGSEFGLENITVQLIDDKGNVVATTTTDANGQYLFTDVPAGTYDIVIIPPKNYTQTYELDGKLNGDTKVTVAPGEEKLDVNFGFQDEDAVNPKTSDFSIPLWVWLSLAGLILAAGAAGFILLRKETIKNIF